MPERVLSVRVGVDGFPGVGPLVRYYGEDAAVTIAAARDGVDHDGPVCPVGGVQFGDHAVDSGPVEESDFSADGDIPADHLTSRRWAKATICCIRSIGSFLSTSKIAQRPVVSSDPANFAPVAYWSDLAAILRLHQDRALLGHYDIQRGSQRHTTRTCSEAVAPKL